MNPAIFAAMIGSNGQPDHSCLSDTLPELTDHLEKVFHAQFRPAYEGTVKSQGSGSSLRLALTGETAASSHNFSVCIPYTSATVGAGGGPAVNDTVLVYRVRPGVDVVLGKVVH